MRKIFLLVITVLTVICPAITSRGADNIAVVNLEKIFREYYKSSIAEQFIRQRTEAVRTYLTQMQTQLNALRGEARTLGTNAINPALNDAERLKARDAAAEAVRKVKAKEAEIELYIQESSRDIRNIETQKRNEIMTDINAAIKRRATMYGVSFVFDCSGKSLNNQPTLLYYPSSKDLTGFIIQDLNRNAIKPKTESKAK